MELKHISRIQDSVFSQADFDSIEAFPECGGIGVFIGAVRNHHEGKAVKALKYTAYAPVAEKMIRQIEQEIQAKYGVSYVRVVHRIGALQVGDTAIIAMAYAPHRREAFAACEEAVERVKHEVPVWKEEFYMDGSSQYVEGCCIRKDHAPEATAHAAQHAHIHGESCEHAHQNSHQTMHLNANIYQWHL